MNMKKCLYIMEGETEKRFLEELKANDWIIPGRTRKYNLMQNRIKPTDSIVAMKYTRVICIIDTDNVEKTNLDNLYWNLKQLKGICPAPEILVQNKNFEDEIQYLLHLKNVRKSFGHQFAGSKDLKKFLAQDVVYNGNIEEKDLQGYCSRNQEFIDIWNKQSWAGRKVNFITGTMIMKKRIL